MSKSPTNALNEVLLAAALRAERFNRERHLESEASQLAKRNDYYAKEFNRVPVSQTDEREHDDHRRQQPA